MKDNHITDLLDNSPPANLSERDLKTIRTHVEDCTACRNAFEAAQLSEVLVKERATEAIEPSPFFQTRVMAAWREQQESNAVPAFTRLWKSAGALVSSMALTTAAIAALSFIIPGSATQPAESTGELIPNSAEAVVLNYEEYDVKMTDDYVWSAIYAEDEEAR